MERIGAGWCLRRPWLTRGTATLYSVYHDDTYRVANLNDMRSDIGFELKSGEVPPEGMRSLNVPGGVYVVTAASLGHEEYNEAWKRFNSSWLPRRGSRPDNLPALDEFEGWPLPWEGRRLRLSLGLDIELGFI